MEEGTLRANRTQRQGFAVGEGRGPYERKL